MFLKNVSMSYSLETECDLIWKESLPRTEASVDEIILNYVDRA